MHSWAFLRKPAKRIRVLATQSRNQVFRKSSDNPLLLESNGSKSYNYGDNEKGYSFLEAVLRSIFSGLGIVGASSYCSSFSNADSSFVSYADSGIGTPEPEKKSSFIFKGIIFTGITDNYLHSVLFCL